MQSVDKFLTSTFENFGSKTLKPENFERIKVVKKPQFEKYVLNKIIKTIKNFK